MLRLWLPFCLVAYTHGTILHTGRAPSNSAASPGQIRFAIENKYDNTGPGAAGQEYAYETYKSLDEALVAFLEDPNTKLPYNDRAKAIANLYKVVSHYDNMAPKRHNNIKLKRPKIVPIVSNIRYFDTMKHKKYFEPPRPNQYTNGEPLKEVAYEFVQQPPQTKKPENNLYRLYPEKSSRLPWSFITTADQYDYKPHPGVEFLDIHIRFAIENKYDNTGPGAAGQEYAYETYKSLDEALVAFLEDPNTKLPYNDRAKAIANLYKVVSHYDNMAPKRHNNIKLKRPKIVPIVSNIRYFDTMKHKKYFEPPRPNQYTNGEPLKEVAYEFVQQPPQTKKPENNLYRLYPEKSSRLPWSFITTADQYDYKPHPGVEFLDIHDRETGDLKSAHELRDGSGAVHGYFSGPDSGLAPVPARPRVVSQLPYANLR